MTTTELGKATQRFADGMRRAIRSPGMQRLIRADNKTRMAETSWWQFKERRELTRRYRLLTDPLPAPHQEGEQGG